MPKLEDKSLAVDSDGRAEMSHSANAIPKVFLHLARQCCSDSTALSVVVPIEHAVALENILLVFGAVRRKLGLCCLHDVLGNAALVQRSARASSGDNCSAAAGTSDKVRSAWSAMDKRRER